MVRPMIIYLRKQYTIREHNIARQPQALTKLNTSGTEAKVSVDGFISAINQLRWFIFLNY